MIVLVIVLTVALLILAAVVIVKLNAQKSERDKYYIAASNIIKEEYLNYCLRNDMNLNEKVEAPNGQKIMLYMKTLKHKQKAQFVFDPEKGVNIGRDSEKNNIFINEASVSLNHCKIFSDNMKVYICDLNSSNGTVLKRGLFAKYLLESGSLCELMSGDRICIGSNVFKITLFYYDMVTM